MLGRRLLAVVAVVADTLLPKMKAQGTRDPCNAWERAEWRIAMVGVGVEEGYRVALLCMQERPRPAISGELWRDTSAQADCAARLPFAHPCKWWKGRKRKAGCWSRHGDLGAAMGKSARQLGCMAWGSSAWPAATICCFSASPYSPSWGMTANKVVCKESMVLVRYHGRARAHTGRRRPCGLR